MRPINRPTKPVNRGRCILRIDLSKEYEQVFVKVPYSLLRVGCRVGVRTQQSLEVVGLFVIVGGAITEITTYSLNHARNLIVFITNFN